MLHACIACSQTHDCYIASLQEVWSNLLRRLFFEESLPQRNKVTRESLRRMFQEHLVISLSLLLSSSSIPPLLSPAIIIIIINTILSFQHIVALTSQFSDP